MRPYSSGKSPFFGVPQQKILKAFFCFCSGNPGNFPILLKKKERELTDVRFARATSLLKSDSASLGQSPFDFFKALDLEHQLQKTKTMPTHALTGPAMVPVEVEANVCASWGEK